MRRFIRVSQFVLMILVTIGIFAQNVQENMSLRFNGLPFYEPWNQGTFAFNDWDLVPANTNWSVSTSVGNPSPSADFSWEPVMYNYSLSIQTPLLFSGQYTCATFWCDFDYKLENLNNTGNEILFLDVFCNGTWNNKVWFSNTANMDWTPMHVDISEGTDTAFKVRFRAEGANSADILHWYVDNIKIYMKCNPPVDLAVQGIADRQVTLTWNAPECAKENTDVPILPGYNLFRSDNNQITWNKLNAALIADTNYTDYVPVYQVYCYYVTSVFPWTCESDSSNITCAEVVTSIDPLNGGRISVYPNPAMDNVFVKSDFAITGIELLNYIGQTIYTRQNLNEKTLKVNVADLTTGVYFVKLTAVEGIQAVKITVTR